MNKIRIHAAVAIAALSGLILCFSSKAQTQTDMPELYSKISTAVVSPHISWAKPYYKGTLRALVIAPRWKQRDTVELMERLDVRCSAVFTFSEGSLYLEGWDWGFESMNALKKDVVEKNLNDALQSNYDVIILAYVPVEKLPKSAIDAILAKVSSGTGLVYIYNGDKPPDNALVKPLTQSPLAGAEQSAVSGIPIETLQLRDYIPPIKDRGKELKNYLSFYQSGKGKVALVNLRSNFFLAYPGSDDLTYEYYCAYMINVILKAAGKESGIQYPGYQPFLSAKAAQPINYTLKLENSNAPVQQTTVTASVRTFMELSIPQQPKPNQGIPDTAASVLAPVWQDKKTVSLPTGASEISFTVPGLAAGDYFLDVQVASAQKNISWSAEKVSVQPDIIVSDVKVSPSALDMNKPGRQIGVQATLNSPAPAGVSLSATLLDNNDRILDVKTASLKEGDTTLQFSFSAEGILSTLGKVRVVLVKNNVTLSVNTGYFTVYHRPWPAFTFFAWGPGTPGTYEDRLMKRILVSLGIDAFRGGGSIEGLKVSDARCIPDMYRLTAPSSDPEYRIGLARQIASSVEGTRPFDPFGYLQGDEFGGCENINPKVFREYLKARYGTIDHLDKQWGFSYSSFDQVVPVTSGPDADRSKKDLNFSYLIDQWSYNWAFFADTVRFCHDTLKEQDPSAKLGFSTPLWNYYFRAYDWPVLMKYTEFFTPYGSFGGDTHFEIGRSFAGPGTGFSMHYGSYANTMPYLAFYEMMPYALLLKGAQNVFWYSFGFGDESGISPSCAPYPFTATSAVQIKKLKDGIGDLFVGASRIKGPIAIHYSEPSFLFSFLVSGPQVPWILNDMRVCLERLGYDYEFISDEQILKGGLSSYKAVFLLSSQCVGADVAEKMKEFVEQGGVLIADVKPGLFDEHGKYWKTSALGELFGLKWKDPMLGMGIVDNPQFTGSYKGKEFSCVSKQDDKLFVDTSAVLDGATAALTVAGAPVLAYRDIGKGTAVCLNIFPYGENMIICHENILAAIFSAHGIQPPVVIKPGSNSGTPGNSINGLNFARFSDGDALYCGFSRFQGDKPVSLTMTFGKKGHLYDLRTGTYLGEQETWDTTAAAPYDAQIYALLPYKVTDLSAELETQDFSQAGKIAGSVKVNISGGTPQRHVIHMRVIRPDGEEAQYLEQNLVSTNGTAAKFVLPMALNEPAGEWKLEFTDAASGMQTTANFTLNKKGT